MALIKREKRFSCGLFVELCPPNRVDSEIGGKEKRNAGLEPAKPARSTTWRV